MARKIITETRRRGIFGKLFKFTFIVFNLAMLAWVISYWITIGEMISKTQDSAGQAGAAIGGSAGTGMLLVIWAIGAGILGALTLATRGKRILIEEITD